MSDEPPAPDQATPKTKRMPFMNKEGKFRPGPKMKEAILEVLSREQAGLKQEYRIVAGRHGVKEASLKKLVALYKKGGVEMSTEAKPIEDKKVALANENERSTQSLLKYENYLNDVFEVLVKRARKELKEENYLAFDQLGIPRVIQQLTAVRTLRNLVEKGNFAALNALMELQRNREAQFDKGKMSMTVNGNVNINNGVPDAIKPAPEKATSMLTREQGDIRSIFAKTPIIQAEAVPLTPPE